MQTKTIFAAVAGVATVAAAVGGYFYKKNTKAKEVKPDYSTMLFQAQVRISFLLLALTRRSSDLTATFADLMPGLNDGGIKHVNDALDKQACEVLAVELSELAADIKRQQILIAKAEQTMIEITAMEKLFARIAEIDALVNMK